MENLRNYFILGLVSVVFVFLSLEIIKNYAQKDQVNQDAAFIDNFISEIKVANLNDYLLETPDTIIFFTDKQMPKETVGELVEVFANYNLLNEMVYINKSLFVENDDKKIKKLFDFDYDELIEHEFIIVIKDFVVIDHFIFNGEIEDFEDFIKFKEYGND